MSQEHSTFPERTGPSKVFLEIGFGASPAFINASGLEERRAQFRDARYIGIDLDEEVLASTKGLLSRHPEQTNHLESGGLYHGTVDSLPLEPESVDEVYIANVFAEVNNSAGGKIDFASFTKDPEKLRMLTETKDEGDPNYDKPEVMQKLLNQMAIAKEALKPGGQLTIVETNTPIPAERLTGHIEELGFVIDRVITREDKLEWAQMEARYQITRGVIFLHEPYIMIAHKPELGEEQHEYTN